MSADTPNCPADFSCAHEVRYQDGTQVVVGDHVSAPAHPRGTLRGEAAYSEHFTCGGCKRPAMGIQTDTGRIYSWSARTRKLKVAT